MDEQELEPKELNIDGSGIRVKRKDSFDEEFYKEHIEPYMNEDGEFVSSSGVAFLGDQVYLKKAWDFESIPRTRDFQNELSKFIGEQFDPQEGLNEDIRYDMEQFLRALYCESLDFAEYHHVWKALLKVECDHTFMQLFKCLIRHMWV